jgi:glycosyltransferase involved in cell wall biosynthesis
MDAEGDARSLPANGAVTITLVTPCINAADRIAQTLRSVVGQTAVQSGRVRLQYMVEDGGSRDDTEAIVAQTVGDQAQFRSQPDKGMYDALARGLASAQGDVVGYLNAGDVLFPQALDTALDVIRDTGSAWLTGYPVTINNLGHVTRVARSFRYDSRLIRAGSYGRGALPFIQQESTLWRRGLLGTVDLGRLAEYRLAGDHYLWSCFSQQANLDTVSTLIGAFRVHEGQLSTDIDGYWAEVARHSPARRTPDRLMAAREALLWSLPGRLRDPWLSRRPITYDHELGRWVR